MKNSTVLSALVILGLIVCYMVAKNVLAEAYTAAMETMVNSIFS